MRRVTYWLLWAFVFTLPWEQVSLPWVGRLTIGLGVAAVGAGVLTMIANGRFRRPGVILLLALAFTFSGFLSLLWSTSLDSSLQRVLTYAQLFVVVWLMRTFATTKHEQQLTIAAYCLGGFVPLVDTLSNFAGDARVWSGALRYSGADFNANDLALTLVLGMPMAWYLFLQRRGTLRAAGLAYFSLAPVAVLLTASRGAFLAGIVALSIVPITLPRRSLRSLVLGTGAVVALVVAVVTIVPAYSWDRILAVAEATTGERALSGRAVIWSAGWSVFTERPVLGVGAGAFELAVEPLLGRGASVHNAFLGVLVEQGVLGFLLFAALIGACVATIRRLPPPERKLCTVLMLTWLVGVMGLGWQYRKITWLLFGLLAAQEADERRQRSAEYRAPASGLAADNRGVPVPSW